MTFRSAPRWLGVGLLLAACTGPRTLPIGGSRPDGHPNGDDSIDGVGPDALANVEKLADGEILLGLLTSRTGPLAGIDRGMINAAWLARSEINAAGGVLGKKLGVLVKDDGSSAEVVLKAWARLVDDPRVVGAIGPTTDSAFEMIAGGRPGPTAVDPFVPPSSPMTIISASAGVAYGPPPPAPTPETTVYAIHGSARDNAAIPSALYVAKRFSGATTAWMAVEQEGESFAVAIAGCCGQVVARERYPDPDFVDYATLDFGEKVERIVGERPDMIVLATYWTDGARITAELSKHFTASYRPQLIGWMFHMADVFVSAAAPDLVEGMIGFAPRPPESAPGYSAFAAAYRDAFGTDPPLFSEGVYDAVYLLAFALERAGRAERSALPPVLPAVSSGPGEKVTVGQWAKGKAALQAKGDIDYDGASGPIDWDLRGTPVPTSELVWTVRSGRIEIVTEVPAR